MPRRRRPTPGGRRDPRLARYRRRSGAICGQAWLLAGLLASVPAWAGEGAASHPVVSVIIDDLGNARPEGVRALSLPGPVAYAFLPHTPHASSLAEMAFRLDKEILLHLPMEAASGKALGPGGLTRAMSRVELERTLRASIEAIPHAAGVNNHMGSVLTRDAGAMRWLMARLRANGGMYFVDSRTTPRSIALRAAREAGVRSAARDVFLDASTDPAMIRKRFVQLAAIARMRGTALGIAHPYPQTLEVLARVLARPARYGVTLVPLAELLDRRAREETTLRRAHARGEARVKAPVR